MFQVDLYSMVFVLDENLMPKVSADVNIYRKCLEDVQKRMETYINIYILYILFYSTDRFGMT